jgi:hypothetical protein
MFANFSFPEVIGVTIVREKFLEAKGDANKVEELYDTFKSYKGNSSIYIAYLGVCETIMASNKFNPFSKLNWFNNGKEKIDRAVGFDKNNPELRFLRLSVQLKAPGFLFYYGNIKEDKGVVLKNINYFKTINIYNHVKLFLLKNASLTKKEIETIQ